MVSSMMRKLLDAVRLDIMTPEQARALMTPAERAAAAAGIPRQPPEIFGGGGDPAAGPPVR